MVLNCQILKIDSHRNPGHISAEKTYFVPSFMARKQNSILNSSSIGIEKSKEHRLWQLSKVLKLFLLPSQPP